MNESEKRTRVREARLRLFAPECQPSAVCSAPGGAAPPRQARHVHVFREEISANQLEFLNCLEHNWLGELWQARDPGPAARCGRIRLAQFLPLGTDQDVLDQLQHVHAHQGLVPLTIGVADGERRLLVFDAPESSLRDRFQCCWQKGLPGIPRAELLVHLRLVADTLDSLYVQHRLQHLNLHPRQIGFHAGCLQVSGFGLVQLLHGDTAAQRSWPRYATPDSWAAARLGRSDQYSLAVIYAALASGVHPWHAQRDFRGADPGRADLALLSSGEQTIIRRALAPDPRQRFADSTQLIDRLEEEIHNRQELALRPCFELGRSLIACPPAQLTMASASELDRFVCGLMSRVAGAAEIRVYGQIRYRLQAGQLLEHRCAVPAPPGIARLRLANFVEQWQATLTRHSGDQLVFALPAPTALWRRFLGPAVGFEIQVDLQGQAHGRCQASVAMRPVGCSRRKADRLLCDMGPLVLESLRGHLRALPELRGAERLLLNQPLQVSPVLDGSALADPIDCQGKDISPAGVGLLLSEELTTPQVYLSMRDAAELSGFAVLARIVRRRRRPDGWIELGASFQRGPG